VPNITLVCETVFSVIHDSCFTVASFHGKAFHYGSYCMIVFAYLFLSACLPMTTAELLLPDPHGEESGGEHEAQEDEARRAPHQQQHLQPYPPA
jgi:hypothetical protein